MERLPVKQSARLCMDRSCFGVTVQQSDSQPPPVSAVLARVFCIVATVLCIDVATVQQTNPVWVSYHRWQVKVLWCSASAQIISFERMAIAGFESILFQRVQRTKFQVYLFFTYYHFEISFLFLYLYLYIAVILLHDSLRTRLIYSSWI